MHAAILLLVACACNFLACASPSAVMEPTAPAGVQKYHRGESHHSLEATWANHVHQPRELAKRWRTLPDRRVLVIAIAQAVARSMGIADTYSFIFEYYFDSELNRLLFNYDHSQFLMRLPAPVVVASFDNGRNVAIPAIVTSVASSVHALLCTVIWGARMRTDSNSVMGIGLFELSVVTSGGDNVRLDPFMYSWRFEALPP